MDRARASTLPVEQCPAGRQLHTLMVRLLVLEMAGEPLSTNTTGSMYWVLSLWVNNLCHARMLALLSVVDREILVEGQT